MHVSTTASFPFALTLTGTTVACEQAFGRAQNWGKGKAKRPVGKHFGPPFHGTPRASDPDASSYWREH